MPKISGHSGLREEYELELLEQTYQKKKARREEQLSVICGVLDKMPQVERRRLLAELCKRYT